MEGPFFIGEFCGKPTLVNRDGVPIENIQAWRVLRAISESNWNISPGQIEQAKKDLARRPRA